MVFSSCLCRHTSRVCCVPGTRLCSASSHLVPFASGEAHLVEAKKKKLTQGQTIVAGAELLCSRLPSGCALLSAYCSTFAVWDWRKGTSSGINQLLSYKYGLLNTDSHLCNLCLYPHYSQTNFKSLTDMDNKHAQLVNIGSVKIMFSKHISLRQFVYSFVQNA